MFPYNGDKANYSLTCEAVRCVLECFFDVVGAICRPVL